MIDPPTPGVLTLADDPPVSRTPSLSQRVWRWLPFVIALNVAYASWDELRVAHAEPRIVVTSVTRQPSSANQSPAHAARASPRPSAAADVTPSPTRGTINLNTATAEELMRLPGIGPAKAERILAWRAKHGAFRRVADLRRVKGFGAKTVKRLGAYLDIKGPNSFVD